MTRRGRVVRMFPNRASLRRRMTALAMEQSEEWVSGRRDLAIGLRWEEQARPVPVVPVTAA